MLHAVGQRDGRAAIEEDMRAFSGPELVHTALLINLRRTIKSSIESPRSQQTPTMKPSGQTHLQQTSAVATHDGRIVRWRLVCLAVCVATFAICTVPRVTHAVH